MKETKWSKEMLGYGVRASGPLWELGSEWEKKIIKGLEGKEWHNLTSGFGQFFLVLWVIDWSEAEHNKSCRKRTTLKSTTIV